MLQITGEAKYSDLIEHTLYNAVLPGISLDGQHYFYTNPLASDGTQRRQPWYDCACCPPNIARTLASIPAYLYSTSDEGIWVHLYAASEANLTLHDGRVVMLKQETDYPYNGETHITIDGEGDFSVFVRIPGWCEYGGAVYTPEQEYINDELTPGSYLEIRRVWKPGDLIALKLFKMRDVECNPQVVENRGKIALMDGPLLYCLENSDNSQLNLDQIIVTSGRRIDFNHSLLGGLPVLRLRADIEKDLIAEERILTLNPNWEEHLYLTSWSSLPSSYDKDRAALTAIPYFSWGNREPGAMRVWLRAR